ncbi:hypothetical protein [Solimicrobium silvestre]|uniref:Uncharacterized protein n=1 Tax=Solimicrobium silvestre TaxID=2099400 RepID=A0A2S9H0D8_9BURK|nr:hypothetical protein [Solimicrobium silvestre]PRC93441.1 hypothetical protein S2091_1828 [Solimicrobium silvestre]
MGRYIPLLSIQIQHEFFEGCSESNNLVLRFLPSETSSEIIQRENLLLRQCANGIEVWQEENNTQSTVPSTVELNLTFLVSSSDPHFNFYTDWHLAKPINFINQTPVDSSNVVHLTAQTVEEQDFGLSSFEKKKNPTLFTVQLQHQISTEVTHYLVELKARAMHWKYYFFGALAKKKLQIVDLDEKKAEGCRFTPSENVVTSTSVAFISEIALPMRSMPTQRFQLREEGAAGRVLMRRLPSASINKIGKERDPNGQSLVVAEIYIHQ